MAHKVAPETFDFPVVSNPASPDVGYVRIYAESDGMKMKDSGGTETPLGGGSSILHNFTATTDPTITDDSGDGYSAGSKWINTNQYVTYVCVDASVGAAIWYRMALKHNFTAIVDPDTANNIDEDYVPGSIWLNTVTFGYFIMVYNDDGFGLPYWQKFGSLIGESFHFLTATDGMTLRAAFGFYSEILNKIDGTTAPTATDDSADGYRVGSYWADTTNDKIYFCIDATATAAIWILVGSGTFTDFLLAGDSGTPQTISDGNTLTIEGGAGIDTVAGATDKVTVAVDSTVIRTTGTQSIGAGLTVDTPTIANFTNMAHDHQDADDGGQLTDAALSSAVGIAKGGTGQTTQTAAFDALSPTTTKGDIIVSDGSDNVRLAVGATSRHVLQVDSAEATGVKWAAAIIDATDNYIFDDSNWQTNSTSFVDIDATDMVATITTTGNPVKVHFHGSFSCNANLNVYLNFAIDGTTHVANDGICRQTILTGSIYTVSFTRLVTGLSAASHTFKMQWRVASNTVTLLAGDGTSNADVHGQFWAEEIS